MEASSGPSCSGRPAPAALLPAPRRAWAPIGCRCRRTFNRAQLRVRAGGEPGGAVSPERQQPDVYRAAAQRLASLLHGVGDGEEELEELAIETLSPGFKAGVAVASGALVACGAWLLCWLIHTDPWGGASLSEASARAAGVGLAAGAPVAAGKLVLRSDAAVRALPLLADVHEVEDRWIKPFMAGSTPLQVAALICAEVGSSMLLLFPALCGGLQLSLQAYAARLNELGWSAPEGGSGWLALGLLAAATGLTKAFDHRPSEEQFATVQEAVSNADRYYRVVGMSASARQEDAARMAAAFKLTAAAWLQQHQSAGVLSALLAASETAFLGGLWLGTGDLSAPTAAALLIVSTELAGIYRSLPPSTRPD